MFVGQHSLYTEQNQKVIDLENDMRVNKWGTYDQVLK